MQQFAVVNPTHQSQFRSKQTAATGTALFLALFIAIPGCGEVTEDRTQSAGGFHEKTLSGTTFTVSCPNAQLASLFTPMANVWAARTGAKVEVAAAPMAPTDSVDIGILPFADLGTWAERGDLHPVPASLKEPGHPYQWGGIFAVYRGEPYSGWGGQVFGLPLAGDGHVIVYRTDRFADKTTKGAFQKQFGRPLTVPTTWEELADVAAFFAAQDKRPSLPSLPTDSERLTALFFRIASCFDRAAMSDAAIDPKKAEPGHARSESLAFQFRLNDGRPRIDSRSFALAAQWLADLKKRGCVPGNGPGDPVATLTQGQAVMAVLSLDELARLRRGTAQVDGYGVAPLPGSRSFVDAAGKSVSTGRNYIPHFGGGWLGVVRKRCEKSDAAFDLLTELGGPTRSLEVIAATGYGPFRDSHLDQERLLVWYGYGFDADQSKTLQDAVRSYIGKSVPNPTYGLRGPEHGTLSAALATELRRIAAGEVSPQDGLKQVAASWDKSTSNVPPEKLKELRRRAVGLN